MKTENIKRGSLKQYRKLLTRILKIGYQTDFISPQQSDIFINYAKFVVLKINPFSVTSAALQTNAVVCEITLAENPARILAGSCYCILACSCAESYRILQKSLKKIRILCRILEGESAKYGPLVRGPLLWTGPWTTSLNRSMDHPYEPPYFFPIFNFAFINIFNLYFYFNLLLFL